MKLFKILANYSDILALVAEVQAALKDKTLTEAEVREITKDLIDLFVKLGLLKT